eukprot:jgi/Tetstr1/420278/TSEL_001027.t1
MGDATPAQLEFMDGELARFLAVGAWERGYCAKWVSRLFLVPKPGTNKWRLIIDLRPLNRYCETRDLSFETLSHLRNLARLGDYMLHMDLQDGFYAVGIAPEDRDFFTVDYRGTLYRLAGLPMGWSLSPYYFCKFTNVLTRALRRNPAEADGTPIPRRRFGLRMLPYMDDFLFLARTQAEAIWQRDYIERHLSGFGLLRNPNKGVWEPTQKLVHLGLEIDTSGSPTLRAPAEKLASIARAAKRLIQRAKRDRRWLPARELAALAGKCQFLYLAIAPARFYLRELHDVLKTRDSWSGRVKLTRQLERDLQWWVGVPTQHNGRPINRPVETGYLHVDSSSYGWGAVLNEHHEARGFWYDDDRNAHITLKELKAVRLAIESFLPMLHNRHIRLHEDNQAVVGVLTNLTSRSPRLMAELRKTWYLMDTHGITLSVRYIRSAANIWADRLSREVDCDDWQFNPRRFASLTAKWGACTIDRFATSENALLPRYNARWRDPRCEAVDALRLSDGAWRCERNWCNPPWNLIGDLVSKLESSGAPAIVIVPYWPDKAWYQLLSEMCSDMRSWKPRHDLFIPGRTGDRLPVGAPRWPVVAFNIPARDPRPWPAAPGIF